MRPRDLALGIATKHTRDLIHPVGRLDDLHVGGGDTLACALRDDDVVVCASGDLREMRDREYLMMLGDAAKGLAHLKTNASADPRVDLVEDEGRDSIEAGEYGFESQHHAGQLPTRCDLRQGTGIVPNVQGHPEFNILRARGLDRLPRSQTHREMPVGHPERGEHFIDGA